MAPSQGFHPGAEIGHAGGLGTEGDPLRDGGDVWIEEARRLAFILRLLCLKHGTGPPIELRITGREAKAHGAPEMAPAILLKAIEGLLEQVAGLGGPFSAGKTSARFAAR